MADIMGSLGVTNMSGSIMGWFQSGIFWVVITLSLTVGLLLFLKIRKSRMLKYACLEIIPFGNGKIGINRTKAGIFKSKSKFGGLWDYGTDFKFKTKDNRIILDATTRDLHDLFGSKGFIVTRKPDDPKVLVPLARFKIENAFLLGEIAPADFRDASVNILEDAREETLKGIEKYLPYIMLGGIIIFFAISMMVATQFFDRTVDKAGDILLKAGSTCSSPPPSTESIAP